MQTSLMKINTHYTKEINMLYVIWVVGVLLAIFASAKLTIGKEKAGKFDE